ncbi:hypothetical protein LX64_01888 [Chitinophaga skermanii]|uniref:Uncharacterized protein n=2 Tax=Chitinophaga skermanii TaxID=331697 RepID=A0A327QR86_9BACT|nr:hypothetical protein LX64_01888 [Chitinophaga skermanii]
MLGIEALLLIPFSLKYPQLDKAAKYIYYYVIASIIFAVGSYYIGMILRQNNMWFVPILQFTQFVILSLFFRTVIKRHIIRQFILGMIGLCLLIFIFDYFKVSHFKEFLSIFEPIRTFILIAYGIIYFIQLLKDEYLIEQSITINTLPNFWFNAGLFIYHCCYFLLALAYNLLQQTGNTEDIKALTTIMMPVHYSSGALQIILFYIGLRKIKNVMP